MTLAAGTTYEINVAGMYAGDSIHGPGTVLNPDITGLCRQHGIADRTEYRNLVGVDEINPEAAPPHGGLSRPATPRGCYRLAR